MARASKTGAHDDDDDEHLGLDQFEMPRTVINRMVKATVRRDATFAFSNCTAVFISYLAQAAQEQAADRKRKTVSADDVLAVIGHMGLPPDAKDILLEQLAAFREAQQAKRKPAKSARKPEDDNSAAAAAEAPEA